MTGKVLAGNIRNSFAAREGLASMCGRRQSGDVLEAVGWAKSWTLKIDDRR